MLQIFADRGGTFTDIVAFTDQEPIIQRLAQSARFSITELPQHQWLISYKLLSEQPDLYQDAVIQGIRDILGLSSEEPIPADLLHGIKMGTTVATNALLERKGDRTLFVTTEGFRDALRIGYQNRSDIFALHIVLPEMLYEQVVEVRERLSAQGEVLTAISEAEKKRVEQELQASYDQGIHSCAIAFMHGYRYHDHEKIIAAIAKKVGFTQISVSHEVSPLMKFVSRSDTTVVDAYLSPILRRYVNQVDEALGNEENTKNSIKLEFMKSDGGLTDAKRFQGKDSILSGPAGGIVGAVKTSLGAGFKSIIGFDMGGTSTDVSHFNGDYERSFSTEVAGVRLTAPMLSIHTVAAGGGSILKFDGARYRVGPESAGAHPGPTCYRKGGPLTVTDCNVMVGKVQPEFFPKVFGEAGTQPLDAEIVKTQFEQLAQQIQQQTGDQRTPEQVASGFLQIAIAEMANAIKKISIQRGYDLAEYTLCCFGGAGGQHACLIAETLGIPRILIHPLAGVLSAYGIGLADVRSLKERAIEATLTEDQYQSLSSAVQALSNQAKVDLLAQDIAPEKITVCGKVQLRCQGNDSSLTVDFADIDSMKQAFTTAYEQRYGFTLPDRELIVESVIVEAIGQATEIPEPDISSGRSHSLQAAGTAQVFTKDQWHPTPIYLRDKLQPGDRISGPALIIETTGTNVIEPGWDAEITGQNHLVLTVNAPRVLEKSQNDGDRPLNAPSLGNVEDSPQKVPNRLAIATQPPQNLGGRGTNAEIEASEPIDQSQPKPDPVMLEIFNNLFRAIAEEMGITLQNTSVSVNIKERLDFSCAIFDSQGQLVANAPHIPVHLGSMSESVKSLMNQENRQFTPGDVFVSNNPYNGGTHLPDITVITPIFANAGKTQPIFYVASRGHHADIGGITPGSMPPHSQSITEEGVLFNNFKLVKAGLFQATELLNHLEESDYPARNTDQNIADLRAQIAANERGAQELHQLVNRYGLETVQRYMQHVQDNAEESVRRAIGSLKDGSFSYEMDAGCKIQVQIKINHAQRSASLDFTGTSPQQPSNLNAPLAIGKAVVLYVFRTLVDDNIPLNAGCMKPLEIHIPKGCFLNPSYPAAVVAGNVETSQALANAIYGALGIMAASQGTMNNLTFGNDQYQYYETICGGSGAGQSFPGTDAVQTHMTNSHLTDPEILEWRFPVLLEEFSIRLNSGGRGVYPGGNGSLRAIRFMEPMTVTMISGHRSIPPFGLAGGEPGTVGRNFITRKNGKIEQLSHNAQCTMNAGDIFKVETPGGGGYGIAGFKRSRQS